MYSMQNTMFAIVVLLCLQIIFSNGIDCRILSAQTVKTIVSHYTRLSISLQNFKKVL